MSIPEHFANVNKNIPILFQNRIQNLFKTCPSLATPRKENNRLLAVMLLSGKREASLYYVEWSRFSIPVSFSFGSVLYSVSICVGIAIIFSTIKLRSLKRAKAVS